MRLSIREEIHALLREVKNARLLASITGDLHERMDIAGAILDEVEKVLEELDDRD